MKIAIQGEPGSNSDLAVREMLTGQQELVPCAISAEVFERLARNETDAAVLPIENSLHGSVADHYDLLLHHDVAIVGEMTLRIRHALIAADGVRLQDVNEVLSHPVALSQCRRFFADHRDIQAVPFYDTAGSVKHLVQTGARHAAAIAAPWAAEVYGGVVLLTDLEDDPQNFTRFFLLATHTRAAEVRSHLAAEGPAHKMSLAFSIPHHPGSLVKTLQGLAEQGADLTRIESRPVPGKPWEYVFFVDLRLNHAASTEQVLQSLHATCRSVKQLGQYAAAV